MALTPLAPIGRAVASVFGFIADSVSRVVGWIGRVPTAPEIRSGFWD
jgi:hypothetical protein